MLGYPDDARLLISSDVFLYRWRSLTAREQVPSLIDEAGFFYSYERIPELLAQAKLSELEVEFRAQIEAVLATSRGPLKTEPEKQ